MKKNHNVTLDSEPIHSFFGLTYASYLILPRVALQSMPTEWQRNFVEMIEQIPFVLPEFKDLEPSSYLVKAKDENNRFVTDRFPKYRHNNLKSLPKAYEILQSAKRNSSPYHQGSIYTTLSSIDDIKAVSVLMTQKDWAYIDSNEGTEQIKADISLGIKFMFWYEDIYLKFERYP